MIGELLNLETAKKLASIKNAIECIKEKIEDIKEYDTERPIYSGEAVIDCLNVILNVLER